MSPDYLDLLLDRVTGSIPLVEPRINTALVGSPIVPQWEEVAEETVRPASFLQPKQPAEPQTYSTSSAPLPIGRQVVDDPQPQERTALQVTSVSREATEASAVAPSAESAFRHVNLSRIGASEERTAQSSNEHPGVSPARSAASVVEAPPIAKESSRVVERAIQTQRWFPPPSINQAPQLHPAPQTRQILQTPSSALMSDEQLAAPLAPAQVQSPAPISIRIDRIEVRAGGSPPQAAFTPRPRAAAPLGLDEYLKRKSGGAQ